MRQGTKVHKKLEDEVHTTVSVSIATKEDRWGLRIWNIVQGLRTLRETGRTRELEVWGVVDGEVVNGVIDELSYECPDPSFASSMNRPSTPQRISKMQGFELDEKRIYITDIKTRSVRTLPSALAARPTEIQLQLYHSLLTSLAQGKVPLLTFAERYGFDPTIPFSDSFIIQVGSLNEQFFDAVSSQSQDEDAGNGASDFPASSQDSIDILLRHNTIERLWDFMIDHLQETFLVNPPPSSRSSSSPTSDVTDIPTRLSPVLTATYVHRSTQTHLGNKTFLHSPSALTAYLSDGMAWWRGERKARGVDIQEVNAKCTRCEFLGECEWIREREREVREEVKQKRPSV